jgi:hypothetical protein
MVQVVVGARSLGWESWLRAFLLHGHFQVALIKELVCSAHMNFRTRPATSSSQRLFLGCLTAILLAGRVLAHTPAEEMTGAANSLLAALTTEQRAKATYEMKDEERFDWHFIPKPRKGLPIKEMTPAQRNLAHALLSTGLSQRGYLKAATIMSLEQVLFDIENQKGPVRDAEMYFVTIFGTPGKSAWGWRAEGHHVSLNFTVSGDNVLAVTPSFMGANPAEVREGPRKGLRVLGTEEDLGRQLVKSLDQGQLKTALYTNTAPREIITANDRKARNLEPMGIAMSSLTKAQKDTLLSVIKEYVYRYRSEIADDDLTKIRKAGDKKIYFAWAGGLDLGQPHYFRIQGPTFLMEYDNTQNNANHVHTVWRDLQNDFGGDLLRDHYEQVPHGK